MSRKLLENLITCKIQFDVGTIIQWHQSNHLQYLGKRFSMQEMQRRLHREILACNFLYHTMLRYNFTCEFENYITQYLPLLIFEESLEFF